MLMSRDKRFEPATGKVGAWRFNLYWLLSTLLTEFVIAALLEMEWVWKVSGLHFVLALDEISVWHFSVSLIH